MLHKSLLCIGFALHIPLTCIAGGFGSGVYQTIPGTTVEERGDRVQGDVRVLPFSATLTFDLEATPPAMTAVIPNAVLEGGEPFNLTVRSSVGRQLTDGSYGFSGDYLREIQPTGSQYLFDWRFASAGDGTVVWNGGIGWAGGHLWQVTISDVALVPEPGARALIIAAVLVFAIRRAALGFCRPTR